MKHKALRPCKLNFMSRTYLIVYPDAIPDNYLGLTHHDKCLIEVKGTQIPLEEADTLVHEVLHMLWHHMGLTADIDDDVEERIVRAMATALTSAFAENPEILNYLKVSLKKESK